MNHHITNANIKEWARDYDGPQFDGILCDPPYELGFMGKSWDSSGIAFDTEMWTDILKLLKPGGHLLAFSGSRTYHRMAVAIEDAGFEIRDQLIWMYGSGFPKSLNIGKAVDKIQGNEREVTGIKEQPLMTNHYGKGLHNERPIKELEETKGTSPYEGYGTALKPSHEPCVLARKPLDGTVANNVLKHGTGGLNIDGTRVAGDMGADRALGKPRIDTDKYGKANPTLNPQSPLGRFPANLIHDGSDEVEAVFPDTGKSGVAVRRNGNKSKGIFPVSIAEGSVDVGFNDSGSASRYFYTAKASKRERNAGLEGFEEKMPWTVESQSTLSDSKFPNANHHPTVKPLSLTKYLATLIKPPTGGRLLVPFSGSGSEMIGALQAGWEYVEGVELTEEYIPIAEARIKHWMSVPVQESLLTTREDK